MGREQRNAVESLLTLIMRHRLQVEAWPNADPARHWRHEIGIGQVQVERRLRQSPKLAAEISSELESLYRDAIRTMYHNVDGEPHPPVPPACPWTLAALLAEPGT